MGWAQKPSPADRDVWNSPDMSADILGREQEFVPIEYAKRCARRLQDLRRKMKESWIGLGDTIDLLLATVIARENPLLLGPPGVAKTEIATQFFKFLGLQQAAKSYDFAEFSPADGDPFAQFIRWWDKREAQEKKLQKYFHLTLNRFTQPEELFGPIEIELLRRGVLVRVNFGFMTSPGVRAAFLDELFKASPSCLSTVLTMANERLYFNWGGMVPSDLVMLIGASNELPGGFATGRAGLGVAGEDFTSLHAFLDRFAIRLLVNYPPSDDETFDIRDAPLKSIQREARRFCVSETFEPRGKDMPGINDVLLLGRSIMQHLYTDADTRKSGPPLFDPGNLTAYENGFFRIARNLLPDRTDVSEGRVTWTLSPRKLQRIYKIGLAYALVSDSSFPDHTEHLIAGPHSEHLRVFNYIWDSPYARQDLENQVGVMIERTAAA
jgi:MoxR-like ATPase